MTGWKCAQCGVTVPWNTPHTCGSAPDTKGVVWALIEDVEAYLRFHDAHLGDDYFDARRREVRMALDGALVRVRK